MFSRISAQSGKRPFYLRWWFLVIAGFVILFALLPKPEQTVTTPSISAEPASDTGTPGAVSEPPSETSLRPSVPFKQVMSKLWPSTVVESASFTDGRAEIVLKEADDYFGSGDGLNKTLAIRSATLFRDVDDLQRLNLKVIMPDRIYYLGTNRTQMAEHYGGDLSSYRTESLDSWRNEFLPRWDTREERERFFEKHVVSDKR